MNGVLDAVDGQSFLGELMEDLIGVDRLFPSLQQQSVPAGDSQSRHLWSKTKHQGWHVTQEVERVHW